MALQLVQKNVVWTPNCLDPVVDVEVDEAIDDIYGDTKHDVMEKMDETINDSIYDEIKHDAMEKLQIGKYIDMIDNISDGDEENHVNKSPM